MSFFTKIKANVAIDSVKTELLVKVGYSLEEINLNKLVELC